MSTRTVVLTWSEALRRLEAPRVDARAIVLRALELDTAALLEEVRERDRDELRTTSAPNGSAT